MSPRRAIGANFYLWGAMGGTAMVGLGIALAQPRRRVLVLTGDGDMLMGLGSLATIAAAGAPTSPSPCWITRVMARPARSAATLGLYRPRRGRHGLWLAATTTARGMDEVEALRERLRREPLFAVMRIAPEE